jgi:ubiquinone/menaquinone biosynthesis C-methylase UbiE
VAPGGVSLFEVRLKTEPAFYDEYRQPCYLTGQIKGLAENELDHLIQGAISDGYIDAIANQLLALIKKELLLASNNKQPDVLEIGGGDGYFFDWLQDDVSSFINIEPGAINLDSQGLKRTENPKYQAIKCSAENIPLYNNSVDIILSCGSFDHIPDYRAALGEINRLLRKGGVFILLMNNRRSWWKWLLSPTDYLKRREEEILKEHYIQWSLAECEDRLSELIPVSKIYSSTFFPHVPKLWRWCLPACNTIGSFLIPRHGGNIIAVCRK